MMKHDKRPCEFCKRDFRPKRADQLCCRRQCRMDKLNERIKRGLALLREVEKKERDAAALSTTTPPPNVQYVL